MKVKSKKEKKGRSRIGFKTVKGGEIKEQVTENNLVGTKTTETIEVPIGIQVNPEITTIETKIIETQFVIDLDKDLALPAVSTNAETPYLSPSPEVTKFQTVFSSIIVPTEWTKHFESKDVENICRVILYFKPNNTLILETGLAHFSRAIVKAVASYKNKVLTNITIVDPEGLHSNLTEFASSIQHFTMTGERFYKPKSSVNFRPWDLIFIDTDPHDFDQTMGWLNSYVSDLKSGLAVFHDIRPARPEIKVKEAIEVWLISHPESHYFELEGEWSLGIINR